MGIKFWVLVVNNEALIATTLAAILLQGNSLTGSVRDTDWPSPLWFRTERAY